MLMTKQSVAARIKALLAKTTDNSCTEAEAMSAASKARELMDRYHIDQGEVGMEEEGVYGATCSRDNWKTLAVKDRLAAMIAQFCDCRAWLGPNGGPITFFGLRPDADFAVWLADSLDHFARGATIAYMAHQPRAKRGADLFDVLADVAPLDAKGLWEREKGFVLGVAERVNERLRQMIAERRSGMGTGRSLVVIKSEIVNREFAKLGLRLGRGKSLKASSNDGGARGAGRAAGDRASFGRPLNGGRAVPMIDR
jgi:hypothetical protein